MKILVFTLPRVTIARKLGGNESYTWLPDTNFLSPDFTCMILVTSMTPKRISCTFFDSALLLLGINILRCSLYASNLRSCPFLIDYFITGQETYKARLADTLVF